MLTQALLDNIIQDYLRNKSRFSDREKFTLPIIRFLRRIRVSQTQFFEGTPCWEWQGPPHPKTGYCEIVIDGRSRKRIKSSPHRFSFLYFVDDLGDDQEPDHLCQNKMCSSPLHLEAVTHQENMSRRGKRQLFCKNGHERISDNLDKHGGCKVCNRERVAAFYASHPGYAAEQSARRKR